MRFPRMTTRRLMIAVALAAFALGTYVCVERGRSRAVFYQIAAAVHEYKARLHADAQEYDGRFLHCFSSERFIANPKLDPRLAEHHAALVRKCEYAAKHPWLSVEPDPSPPE